MMEMQTMREDSIFLLLLGSLVLSAFVAVLFLHALTVYQMDISRSCFVVGA